MHDLIKFLSPVVDRTPAAGIFGCYVFDGKSVRAQSRASGITAGAELPSPQSFSVPASELDEFLKRVAEVTGIEIEGDCLAIRGGRLRTTIQLCADEAPPVPAQPAKWMDVGEGFAAAMKLALPFVGDRHWTAGVRLWQGKATALSGVAGIEIDLPWLDLTQPVLLPAAAVAFLSEQDDPAELTAEDGSVSFRWTDGRWMRAQLLAVQMDEKVVADIFSKGGSKAPVKITDEARAAYADAAALGDGTVWVRRSGFEGRKGVARTKATHEMPIPEDHVSAWGTKHLDAVMACADAWNPGAHPDVCIFKGNGLRGLIVGVNK